MSEWFDLCRGLRRIARHNSRCENGWLISFYSWHRGLSVWLCAHSAQLGAHTGYWQWPASARPGDTELILARGQAAHTRPPGTQETHGASGRAASVYGSDLARAEASSAASLADWSRAVHQAARRELIGLSLAKLPPSRLLGQAGQARPWSLSITRSPDPISSNL